METPSALTQLVLNSWDLQLTRFNQLLHALSDDCLLLPMAPGRSRGIYILGHLIAVHDRMIPTLYLGEQMYGSWHDTFLKNPDDPKVAMPSVQELRAYWSSVNQFL
ncbi:MAG: DinB family protein, partial [Saprospiraceae bacterium]|nr:DinB family protein [Saprospiraceae bacterium]